MMSTLPRRTAVVVAAAAAAFSGMALAGSAVTANAAAKAHTSLSIRVGKASINPGGSDNVSGMLRAGGGHVAGRKIELLDKPQGSTAWSKLDSRRAGAHGFVNFEVTPSITTRYVLAFAGNKLQRASRSAVGVVRVRSTTSLTIALSANSIEPGDSDTITGVLSLNGSPLVGDTVDLASRHGKQGWKKMASGITASDGSVTFTVTPAVTTRYVLAFKKTETDPGARSAVATVHVLQSSSLSIRAREQHKTGNELISGDLRGGGHALAHRKIMLEARPSGTSTWTTVATHRTNKNGAVGFSVPAPTVSEDYQLVYSGGPIFDGCQSGVVTVTVS